MGSIATLTGFPEVSCVDIFQGSHAKPGQIVIDTLVLGSGVLTEIPRVTSLTIQARSNTMQWTNIRVVKAPRQYGAFMRTVFEDSRWKLGDVLMPQNFNSRDCNGIIYPDSEKTIAELIQEIQAASELTITTASLPNFKPDAPWRGLTAMEAMDHLLMATACRMVYKPSTQEYVVSGAGSGTLPDLGERLFRPVPAARYAEVKVRTAPITYEKKFQCSAVVWDESNQRVVLTFPERIFNNFADVANTRLRSKCIHSALRLWRPADANVVLLGRRALTVAPGDDDSEYAAMVFTAPELARVPLYGQLSQPFGRTPNVLSLTAGGKIFQCEQAYMMIDDGGAIKTTAEILSAYYKVVGGELERESQTVSPGGTGTLVLDFDWIRPVESSESDISGSGWAGIHNAVVTAVTSKYANPPQHVTVPTIASHGAPGRLGGIRYVLKLGHQADSKTSFAFDFDPADARAM